MTRVAALDLGTNSFLCYIAEIEGGRIKTIHDQSEIVRIGEGVDQSGLINESAMSRAKSCLEDFSQTIKKFKADKVRAIATSAARDAKNSDEFVKLVESVGLPIDVISGEEEARLTYVGATHEMGDCSGCGVVDVGGGSTEFIFSPDNQKVSVRSLNIGGVRLKERFLKNDPPTAKEIQDLAEFVKSSLGDIKFDGIKKMVAVGGTPTTLSCVKHARVFDTSFVNGDTLSRKDLENTLSQFMCVDLEKRKTITGLSPRRADIIIVGNVILLETLKHFGLESLNVSAAGVRVGVALELLA